MKPSVIKHFFVISVTFLASLSCDKTNSSIETLLPTSQSMEIISTEPLSFVTQEQAKIIANTFLGAKDAHPLTKVSQYTSPGEAQIQTISKCGEPMMYVVNYDEGGFVIVSATRDYLPILAYSREGQFDITSINGGLSLWIDEMMTAIETSGNKADSLKTSMNKLWKVYEETNSEEIITTKATGVTAYTQAEIACMERCEELFNLYGGDGWNFLPLSLAESVFTEAGYSYYYDNLCYSAQFNNSGLSSSVVGWKSGSFTKTYGPILTTYWHQNTPFNDLCNGFSAGCGAIALAQVMKHFEYPSQITYNSESFGWNTIPSTPDSASNQSKLIKEIGNRTNTRYWSIGSWTTPAEFEEGIESFGYNVIRQDDNCHDVKQEVLNKHRPVIMLGNSNNLSVLPGSAEYIGNSHYWVIDGAKNVDTNVFMVFAEWQPNDCGEFTQSHYSVESPDIISGVSYLYYHCNWGWGSADDSWYAFDSNNYQYSRQNFFISLP